MKVLFDLVHPADALFFYHPMRMLEAAGASVRIVSREKDVLIPLLDELGLEHESITAAGAGVIGLGAELLGRSFRIWKLVREFRPDVLVGFGGVSISHVGCLTGVPSVSFYDTEHATLQIRLTVPFISEWHVPACWSGLEARGRTFRFQGSKQFAYLSPDYFVPDNDRARRAGWIEGVDNFMLRVVAWSANHDWGKSGIPEETIRRAVAFLSSRGRVHISAEGELPTDLEPYRYRGGVVDFHHLLSRCRLCFGESITVASEAVALGVPTVLQNNLEYGYAAEQITAGLIERVSAADPIEDALEAVLSMDAEVFRQRARDYVTAAGDVNRYVTQVIVRRGSQR